MTSWTKLQLHVTPLAQTVKAIDRYVIPTVDDVVTIIKTVQTIASFLEKFLVEIPDLEVAVLKAAIKLARDVMKDLTGDAGVYYLPIPVHVVNILPAGTLKAIAAPKNPGLGLESIATEMLPPVGGGNGGNYGFLKDLSDSLHDQEDTLRPQFDSDAHVAGVVVLAGADSYLKLWPLIQKLVRLFSGGLGAGTGAGLADSTMPKPKNMRWSIVPAAIGGAARAASRFVGTGTHPYAVRVEWDRDVRVLNFDWAKMTTTVSAVTVYRSEKPIPAEQRIDTNEDLTKLGEFEYDGTNSFFTDASIKLGKDYYYAVQYKLIAASTDTTAETVDAYPTSVSPKISVPENMNMLPRRGVPPDWLLLPSPLSMIPQIMELVDQVDLFLSDLEKRLDTGTSNYKKYIKALKATVDKYLAYALELANTIRELLELFHLPFDLYTGVYTFSGKGGNSFMLNSVTTALTNKNDTSRPPFDRGDEIVIGFVLYAGSATAGKLTAFMKLLETLFSPATSNKYDNLGGGTKPKTAPAPAGSPTPTGYAAALTSLSSVTSALENASASLDAQLRLYRYLAPDPGVTVTLPTGGIGPDLEPALEQNDGKECTTG